MRILNGAAAAAMAIAIAACSSGGGSGGGGGGGTPVTGTASISDTGGTTPANGATVEAVGGPSTTADATGNWTLLLASNESLTIRATAANALGSQTVVVVPPGGLTIDLSMVADSEVSALGGILGTTIDSAKGIVVVGFLNNNGPGYAASLSAASGGSFVFNNQGTPVAGSTTTDPNNPIVIFYNVDVGTTTVTNTPPNGTCTDIFNTTSYPVDAGVITNVELGC